MSQREPVYIIPGSARVRFGELIVRFEEYAEKATTTEEVRKYERVVEALEEAETILFYED